MSGVWQRLLSVQDSRRPQDITHAGEGTEALQSQVMDLGKEDAMSCENPKVSCAPMELEAGEAFLQDADDLHEL